VNNARILIAVAGILLPYAARIPGAVVEGPGWFASYLPGSIAAFLFVQAWNAVCWGSVLAATFAYRSPRSAWFPAILGFAYPLYEHATLDLLSDAQAALGLIIMPIYSLPLVFVGAMAGLIFDRWTFGEEPRG
jgi:hypothetical protein